MTYRTNAHCHIDWCVEGANHLGWHYGEEEPNEDKTLIECSIRCAPPNATNADGIVAHTLRLSPSAKKGLNIGNGLERISPKCGIVSQLLRYLVNFFRWGNIRV